MRALLNLLILLLMVFVCPFPCSQPWDTEKGLTLHQNSCLFVNARDTTQDAAVERRNQRKLQQKADRAVALAAPAPQPATIEAPVSDIEMPAVAGNREPLPLPHKPTPPPPEVTGRGARAKRHTWKLLQHLPPPPIEFDDTDLAEPEEDNPPDDPGSEYRWESVKTVKNSFGMFRKYPSPPTHDPDLTISLTDQSNIPAPVATSVTQDSRLSPLTVPPESGTTPYGPFKNSTVFGFMNWIWSGSAVKSIAECTRLLNFLKSDAFRKEDRSDDDHGKDFDLKAETKKFDKVLDIRGVTSRQPLYSPYIPPGYAYDDFPFVGALEALHWMGVSQMSWAG
ncbi:hypothetical protein C8F04DRAFT_1204392 [Mycena alexandri]|uniref:Uncharacterized protein n=1 Tax=Mycena alexandri TaxID=1745969 RepID=A0AAD6WKT6_9AGAR|nr:hypothetical protein C8F04DRAFT_1204392 [Mycena alexandri]